MAVGDQRLEADSYGGLFKADPNRNPLYGTILIGRAFELAPPDNPGFSAVPPATYQWAPTRGRNENYFKIGYGSP